MEESNTQCSDDADFEMLQVGNDMNFDTQVCRSPPDCDIDIDTPIHDNDSSQGQSASEPSQFDNSLCFYLEHSSFH